MRLLRLLARGPLAAAMLLSLLGLADAPPLRAAEVAVFLEKDIKIYRLALERFTDLAKQDRSMTFQITSYFMDGDEKRGREILATIQAKKPNLIFAIGTGAALLAHESIKDIPIVYSMVLNPHTYPLSGKNVCGISLDISPKEQLEFLKRVKRDVKKVGVIYNPANSENLIEEAHAFARANQFDLIRKRAESIKEAITAIKELESDRVDSFLMMFDPVVANETVFKVLLTFSLKNKIALIVPADAFVKAGALFSVGADYDKIGEQAWNIARKILHEQAKPTDFGIRYPEETIIAVNDRIAKSLGLQIPRNLVDKVY